MSGFCMIYTSLATHFFSPVLLAWHSCLPYNLPPMNAFLFDLSQKCIERKLSLTQMTEFVLFWRPVNRHDGYMGGRRGGVGVFSVLRYMFTCSLVTDYLFNCYTLVYLTPRTEQSSWSAEQWDGGSTVWRSSQKAELSETLLDCFMYSQLYWYRFVLGQTEKKTLCSSIAHWPFFHYSFFYFFIQWWGTAIVHRMQWKTIYCTHFNYLFWFYGNQREPFSSSISTCVVPRKDFKLFESD